jgi:tRNA uridine 5-carbamoylmethylation protein Kti12
MKIIIVTGDSRTGKTTTLAKDFRCWLQCQEAEEISVQPTGNNDYEGVFKYKEKTIAVHSAGDAYYLVVYAIAKYADKDILVLAGNTNMPTIANLVEVIKENKTHCVLVKEEAADQDNKHVLNEIIAAL